MFFYIKRTRDGLNPGESRSFYCLRTIRKCALASRCKTGRLKELTSCGDKASHQLSNDTISTFIFVHFYHQAGLCFKDRLWSECLKKKRKEKSRGSRISEAVCVAFHCNVHIISEHTSKISNQSAQYARPGQWTVSPLWERRRIWLMCSRSPRLWLIIITGCWNNDFPSACSASRRTRGIWRFFLWWLNTWVWIWGIKAGLDTTKCALWSSIQVINSALARTVNYSSWIIHNSATDIVFFLGGAKKKKCDGVSPVEGIWFSHFWPENKWWLLHIPNRKQNKYKTQEGNKDRCMEGRRWGILKNGQWIMKNDSFLTMLKG